MNFPNDRAGLTSILASFGLSALPPDIYVRTLKALQPGTNMAVLHEAANAIANEAPVTCLEGVITTLLYLANPGPIEFPQPLAGSELLPVTGVTQHG